MLSLQTILVAILFPKPDTIFVLARLSVEGEIDDDASSSPRTDELVSVDNEELLDNEISLLQSDVNLADIGTWLVKLGAKVEGAKSSINFNNQPLDRLSGNERNAIKVLDDCETNGGGYVRFFLQENQRLRTERNASDKQVEDLEKKVAGLEKKVSDLEKKVPKASTSGGSNKGKSKQKEASTSNTGGTAGK